MASNHTENYGLCQWEAMDDVLRTEFNEDNTKIDTALKTLADKDSTLAGTLTTQAAAIATLGNCNIQHFTYVGNGACGSGNPTRVTFPRMPLVFLIMGKKYFSLGSRYLNTMLLDLSENNAPMPITWSGTTISFLSDRAEWQLNTSGETYHVFIFFDLKDE